MTDRNKYWRTLERLEREQKADPRRDVAERLERMYRDGYSMAKAPASDGRQQIVLLCGPTEHDWVYLSPEDVESAAVLLRSEGREPDFYTTQGGIDAIREEEGGVISTSAIPIGHHRIPVYFGTPSDSPAEPVKTECPNCHAPLDVHDDGLATVSASDSPAGET